MRDSPFRAEQGTSLETPSRASPTQGLNLGLLNCRQILYQLSHQGCLISYVCKYITFLITLWDERLATLFQAHRIIGVPRATLRGLVLLSLASTCMQTPPPPHPPGLERGSFGEGSEDVWCHFSLRLRSEHRAGLPHPVQCWAPNRCSLEIGRASCRERV